MGISLYQVDAFTERIFSGNPAGVCILEEWLEEELMQNIAAENNLSETAFAVAFDGRYQIRWFTPGSEVDLCGHATLATAHVLFKHLAFAGNKIVFQSRKRGELAVLQEGDFLTLDFPADTIRQVDAPQELIEAVGKDPVEVYRGGTDYLLIYDTQREIEEISPEFPTLAGMDVRGIIVSAPGEKEDFVSRFFAPGVGINEDPVTGSAHTTLAPYWSEKLGKDVLSARQLSRRQGELRCKVLGSRVYITGKAATYFIGEIGI